MLSGKQAKIPFGPRTVPISSFQSSLHYRNKGTAQITCLFNWFSFFPCTWKPPLRWMLWKTAYFSFIFVKAKESSVLSSAWKVNPTPHPSLLPAGKDRFCPIVVSDFRYHVKIWATRLMHLSSSVNEGSLSVQGWADCLKQKCIYPRTHIPPPYLGVFLSKYVYLDLLCLLIQVYT